MNGENPKRDKPDFVEDFTKPKLESSSDLAPERPKEKPPPLRSGPLWEVEVQESETSDFVKDFFKPT